MMIEVICPACLSRVEIDAKYLGKRGKCKECSHLHTVAPIDELPSSAALLSYPIASHGLTHSVATDSSKRTLSSRAIEAPEMDAILVADAKIILSCSCNKKLKVGLHAQGKSVRCAGCQQSLQVPSLKTVEAFVVEAADDFPSSNPQQTWL